MIRLIVAAIALVIMSIGFAHAQTVQKVEIYEFGTYTSNPGFQVGLTRQGLAQTVTDRIDLVEATQTIVARVGVAFGFRYRVSGKPRGAPVVVKIVTKIPPPGIFVTSGSAAFVLDEETWPANLDFEKAYIWPFEKRSDLVPGIWTFEFWIDGKKFAEQKFNVTLPPIANRQSPAMLPSRKVG